MAKAWIPRLASTACHEAILTIGHVAYSREHPAQLRLRDVLATELGEGPANTQADDRGPRPVRRDAVLEGIVLVPILTAEQELFAATVRRVATERIDPIGARMEADDEFPFDLLGAVPGAGMAVDPHPVRLRGRRGGVDGVGDSWPRRSPATRRPPASCSSTSAP